MLFQRSFNVAIPFAFHFRSYFRSNCVFDVNWRELTSIGVKLQNISRYSIIEKTWNFVILLVSFQNLKSWQKIKLTFDKFSKFFF